MKTKIFSAFCLISSMFSCSKDCDIPGNESQDNLVSPRITATVNSETGYSPLTGILEVYPCESNSSIYYGNYVDGKLTPFNGYYRILEGHTFGDYNRVLSLPDNFYNFVYWGTPKYEEPIYSKPQIGSPGLVIGADLSQLYFTLRENDDKTCAPVYDLVFAQKETHTSDDFKAELKRVVAGLKVTVKNSGNGTFSSNIKSMEVHVGSIAEKLNFYTAQPENQMYLSGGFSAFLNVSNACKTGLLSPKLLKKCVWLGNSSLEGCAVYESKTALAEAIASRATYIDLAKEAGFSEKFMRHMFFGEQQ